MREGARGSRARAHREEQGHLPEPRGDRRRSRRRSRETLLGSRRGQGHAGLRRRLGRPRGCPRGLHADFFGRVGGPLSGGDHRAGHDGQRLG